MPDYRIVFKETSEGSTIRSVSFSGRDPAEALLIAQRHQGPAELWSDDQFICTLQRSGRKGGLWIITGGVAPEPRA